MRWHVIRLLSRLFPVRHPRIETPEEMGEWRRYEVPNHHELDPFRPIGHRDSWARLYHGRKADYPGQESSEANSYRTRRARVLAG